MADTINELLIDLQELMGKIEAIGFGDDTKLVTHNSVTRPTLQKNIADKFLALQALIQGQQAYETKALMDADLAHDENVLARVWNDTVENSGIYGKQGASGSGSWVKSNYDPLNFSYSSDFSNAARNAGFEPVYLNKYHSKGGTLITADPKNTGDVTITKGVTTGNNGTWYGAWIEVNYTSLEELNVEFIIEADHLAGGNFGTMTIMKAKGDWGSGSNAVFFGNKFNTVVNIYDQIMATGDQAIVDYYSSVNTLYIAVGHYTASVDTNNATTAQWKFRARFNRGGVVVASELSSELNLLLSANNQSVAEAVVSDLGQPISITKEFISGSYGGANASVSVEHKNSAGNVYGAEGILNTESVSYSYLYCKISDNYSSFINKRYRVFIESDQALPMIVRVGNGSSWGSSDGSVATFINSSFVPTLENKYSGYVDIDIPQSSAVAFYADPVRQSKLDLYLIVGLDNEASVGDMNLKLCLVDLDKYELMVKTGVDFSEPMMALGDINAPSIPSMLIDLNNIKESGVNSSKNAGVGYLGASKVYPQSGRDLRLSGSPGDGGVVATKFPESESYSWYGLRVAIDYNNLTDLDADFYLGYEHVSGVVPGTFLFTSGKYSDWGGSSNAVQMGAIGSGPYNLYDLIIAAGMEGVYGAQNTLYINLAAYNGDNVTMPAAESVWKVDPYFLVKTSKVVASELSPQLEATLSSSLLNGGNYITCWGDSLTAGGGWTTKLAELSGYAVRNGGTGGENSQTIMARQGADAMVVNNITIPADTAPVLIADRDVDVGISTVFGNKVTPLLQGGAHVNPVLIGSVEGVLSFTGSSHSDMTGDWVFSRSVAGSEVVINRPTMVRTEFDRLYNSGIQVVFIGQNGGYSDVADLVWQNRKMLEHSGSDKFIVLGLSSGSAALRADYEAAMRKEFGRRFVSLREYLSSPIYDVDGTTVISCYGLDDAGLVSTQADLDAIATGTVPPQCLSDAVHYTTATKTVIGEMLFKKMTELNYF